MIPVVFRNFPVLDDLLNSVKYTDHSGPLSSMCAALNEHSVITLLAIGDGK